MNRDLSQLTSRAYDLIVVGGGITGANIAWDATLRGLRVALLEKQDFGGATSANSLKTVHGGLRYLQDGNLRLVRKMIRERQVLLRVAPHLVHPLPVMMPTFRNKLMRSKLVLGTAVKLNDLASFDRNFGMDRAHALPNSRILSRREALEVLPGLNDTNLSGGVLWYDAQIYNTERLLLAILLAAAEAGAQIANYVGVTGFLREGSRVIGVYAMDDLTGARLELRGQMVINAAGPWIDELLAELDAVPLRPQFPLSTAMNLVTRQILPHHAVGLTGHYVQPLPDGLVDKRARVLFVAPWRDYSLVGTLHAPYSGRPDDQWVTERMICDFIAEINDAYPGAQLSRQDIYHVHSGFLPMVPKDGDPTTVSLIREGQVTDHARENGIDGLITAVGVKYTTGRYLAEKTVDLVFQKMKRPSPDCQTRQQPIYGGQSHSMAVNTSASAAQWSTELPPYQLERLWRNYGSAHTELLPYIMEEKENGQPVSEETAVTHAEIIHAVRAEMAQRLSDVVLRRTEMGSAGPPSQATLNACAHIMAAELGWGKPRMHQELDGVWAAYEIQQRE